MAEINLVFIPSPGVGHLASTIEIAKILLTHDHRLSITFLVSNHLNNFSVTNSIISDRLDFLDIPLEEESESTNFFKRIESMKPAVKKMISERRESQPASSSPRLAGFVIDMFFTPMIDVANELGVPSYVYFTSNASFLAVLLHVQKLCDDEGLDITDFKDSDVEFSLPGFMNPIPARLLPSPAFSKEHGFMNAFNILAREFRRAKGILVNSFTELESHAVQSLGFDCSVPQIYPVGPVVSTNDSQTKPDQAEAMIMEWLDCHPPASVLLLCFGSMGAFGPLQVKEMASGIESSGCRFLWSLRRPAASTQVIFAPPQDYEDFSGVLPEGFLERTAGVGKVIGWAPQAAVLGHPAVGGFVSHCGWNSILESLWFGVPIATLPLYAEQQLNAFGAVKEMGIGVEISVDYRLDLFKPYMEEAVIVRGEDIERGIRQVMKENSEVRKKVKLMMKKCREAIVEGGSSYNCIEQFLDDLRKNTTL